jgi:LAS superfamily LD-carboxypeptidase LdcB
MVPALLIAVVLIALSRSGRSVPPIPEAPKQNEELVTPDIVPLRTVDGHYLRTDAARAFDRAVDSSASTPRIASSFRTREQQERLYALYLSGKGNLAAKPGTSKHEFGLAIDGRGSVEWERAMSANGFKRTVASEPWHWEFKP